MAVPVKSLGIAILIAVVISFIAGNTLGSLEFSGSGFISIMLSSILVIIIATILKVKIATIKAAFALGFVTALIAFLLAFLYVALTGRGVMFPAEMLATTIITNTIILAAVGGIATIITKSIMRIVSKK